MSACPRGAARSQVRLRLPRLSDWKYFALGWFDLYDIGAEIREDETGVGTGNNLRELKNPYSSQGSVHPGHFLQSNVRIDVSARGHIGRIDGTGFTPSGGPGRVSR